MENKNKKIRKVTRICKETSETSILLIDEAINRIAKHYGFDDQTIVEMMKQKLINGVVYETDFAIYKIK